MNDKEKENKGDLVIVEDLFVTGSFLLKGKLERKGQRLSRILEIHREPFLSVKNAVKTDFETGETLSLPQVFLNIKHLVFAHEFLDLSGDTGWKGISKERDLVRVVANTSGDFSFSITGLIPPAVLSLPLAEKRFIVMEDSEVKPLTPMPGSVNTRLFSKLSYIILRRDSIVSIYGLG